MSKRKLFKIVLICLISFLIILSIGFIIIVNFVDPNQYKPLIIKTVNSNTGRNLKLDGNISWQIWPNIGLQIKQISLSNPDGFESKNFVEIQSAKLSVDLIPLFRNKIVINDLSIDGLKLNLTEKNHKNNWTFTANKSESSENQADFELHSFSIANSDINYINVDKKTSKSIKNLNFRLDTTSDGGINFDSEKQQLNLDGVNFNLNNNLKGTIQLEFDNDKQLSYKGNITLAPFSLNKTFEQLDQKPIKVKNSAILDNVSLNTNFNGGDESASLTNLHLVVGQSNFDGNVNITNLSSMNVQNDLSINQLELSDWIDTSGYVIPMHGITLRGVASNANEISKLSAQEHLDINNITLYGIDADAKIRYAEKTFTVSQFANPINLVESLNTMLSPSSYTHKNLKQKTNLGHLSTDIVIKNGILTTPGFVLNGPTFRMTNAGYANLGRDYIDYRMFTKIVSVPANSLLGGLTIPYIIKGNLNNPDTSVDKMSLQKQIVNYYIKVGKINGTINNIKEGTANLWHKIFH